MDEDPLERAERRERENREAMARQRRQPPSGPRRSPAEREARAEQFGARLQHAGKRMTIAFTIPILGLVVGGWVGLAIGVVLAILIYPSGDGK